MRPKVETISLTADGTGTATSYSSTIRGRVAQIDYIKDDYLDTVDFIITGETTGIILWAQANVTASVSKGITQPAHDQAGAAISNAYRDVHLVNERVKFLVSSAGSGRNGSFRLRWDKPDE